MTTNEMGQPPRPGPEHKRLERFVGTWNTEGEIEATPSGAAVKFRATDTYEWLPGGFFLDHRWDAHMPDGDTKGIEIIGYDASSKAYFVHSYDSRGQTAVMQARVEGDAWTFSGESMRFTGRFRDDGNTLAGVWERRSGDASDWRPWMDVTLTRAR